MTGKWDIKQTTTLHWYWYSAAALYIFTDAKSTLNIPPWAFSIPSCLDPATLFTVDAVRATVYSNCPSSSTTGFSSGRFNGWWQQCKRERERPPASSGAHGPSCRDNCQLAFALSEAVWLSHRAIIMIQPWVRLRLKGETHWSCVTTAFFHITNGKSFRQDYVHMETDEQTWKRLCVSQGGKEGMTAQILFDPGGQPRCRRKCLKSVYKWINVFQNAAARP